MLLGATLREYVARCDASHGRVMIVLWKKELTEEQAGGKSDGLKNKVEKLFTLIYTMLKYPRDRLKKTKCDL